jgi:hypothetical protein
MLARTFPGGAEDARISNARKITETPNPSITQRIIVPLYEEPEDESLFQELMVIHAREVYHFESTGEGPVLRMGRKYNDIGWAA